jgi:hypothetical protein
MKQAILAARTVEAKTRVRSLQRSHDYEARLRSVMSRNTRMTPGVVAYPLYFVPTLVTRIQKLEFHWGVSAFHFWKHFPD